MSNHQRSGAVSNAHVGRDFEDAAQEYFGKLGISLSREHLVEVGYAGRDKKPRRFDLGSSHPAILVECKSSRWTETGKVPSAKLTSWVEAMLYFNLAGDQYRKILFVLRDFSDKRGETLANHFVRRYGHLIPPDVEVLEFDEQTGTAEAIPVELSQAAGRP